MPPVDVRPSQTEVNAIKHQLKLLGHTLPTNVIVQFLQENSGLLTAYQHPELSVEQSSDHAKDHSPAGITRRGHLAGAEPGFASRLTQPVTQTIPELDVTWASAAPSRTQGLSRPFQVTPCMPTVSVRQYPIPCFSLLEQFHVLHFRVWLAQVRHHTMTASPWLFLKHSKLAQSAMMCPISVHAPGTACETTF